MSLIPNQKSLFDIPADVTYLNCAAQSPALKDSYAAGERGLGWKLHPWDPDRDQLAAEMGRARELFGHLIASAADNIALMTSTSYGAAIAAANLSLSAGKNIVLLQDQFPSNYYCWQHVAARDSGTIKTVARPADGNWTDAVINAIDEKTGIVALPNCHWTDGGRLDLEKIALVVHAQDAAFVIDATQSIGMHEFDVAKLDPDFVACSAYKWLLSPDAAGFLYVAPRHLDGRPIEDNHAGRIGETSMEVGAGYGGRYQTGAVRFDQGASDSMVHIPMAVSAMARIGTWGVANIDATMRPLTNYIAEQATARGLKVPPATHRVSHFIGLYPDAMPEGLIPQLKAQNIHVSLRGGAIRVSPYLFNDRDDVDRLFAALDPIFSF